MKKIVLAVLVLIILVLAYFIFFAKQPEIFNIGKFNSFKTDLTKKSVDLDKIIMAGDGKDSIPALTNPQFVDISQAQIDDDVLGVLVDIGGERRYYPYNILVWHEVVNDVIGDTHFAVTFCPLCRSAIVFDRQINNKVLEFGVSGFLYESNLLMYDKQTESLWSQAGLEAIVGDYVGTELKILPMQLVSFATVKEKYPEAKVLSRYTGYDREYDFYPYREYDKSDELLFPVSVDNLQFKPKEVMFVIPWQNWSIAFPHLDLENNKKATLDINGDKLIVLREDDKIAVSLDDEELPSYYEMWFSWATQHKNNGIVWPVNQCLTEIQI